MVAKGNVATLTSINSRVLETHLQSAVDCFKRSVESAGEAAAHAYLLYRNTRAGDPRKWLEDLIAKRTKTVEDHNQKIDDRFERAENFVNGSLSQDDEINRTPKGPADKAALEKEKEALRSDAKMEKAERRKLRMVAIGDQREASDGRSDAKIFAPLVKCVFSFHNPNQNSLVSRYCTALAWIHNKFREQPNPDVASIKAAFDAEGGFYAVVDSDKKSDDGDEKLIKDDAREIVRNKIKEIEAKATIPITVSHSKDGFTLLLARVEGDKVEVIGESGLADSDIVRAVDRFGDGTKIQAEPTIEFLWRVVRMSELIPEGAEVKIDETKEGKRTTQRMIAMRQSNDEMELTMSLVWAESGPVLHARPHKSEIMALPSGAAVLQIKNRNILEKELADIGRRALTTITADINPTTGDGKDTDSPMRWKIVNSALTRAKRPTAVKQVYWTDISKIKGKPLDVDNFQPQFLGTLDSSAMDRILKILPQLSKNGDKPKENKDYQSAESSAEAKGGEKVEKTIRSVIFKIESNKMTVSCGDADPLVIDFPNDCKRTVIIRMRVKDVRDTFTSMLKWDCTKVKIEGDSDGLVKFTWDDTFGHYALHQPTCTPDGRLQSRRVMPMRIPETMARAAE